MQLVARTNVGVAVAEEVVQVIYHLESWSFAPFLIQFACQGILGQNAFIRV